MKNTFKYLEIYNYFKEKIEKNEFPENSKLPSIRFLAQKFNVNHLTILKVYNLLESDGYIIKKQGAGVFVKPKEYIFYNNPKDSSVETFNKGFRNINTHNNAIINFVSGSQDYDENIFIKLKEILLDIPSNIMNYANTQGDEELRKVIKLTLLQKKMDISIKNIQIINGAQQGLDLIMKSIISKTKNKIIVGSPTYHGALNIFKNNCKIFTVTMENDGFNMLELEELLQKEKISFIYTMMDFNCPTGISWSNEKKKQLIHLAQKYKTYILEDDFASDLYYKEKRRIFLKNLDKENKHVIYMKSYSKILAPGLRLAFMILPNELIEKIKTSKFLSDISSSSLDQYILKEFLKRKILEKNIKTLREKYEKRYLFLKEKLEKIKFLNLEYEIEGGFYIWVKLDERIDYNKFYIEAQNKGVYLLPAFSFYLDNKNRPYFRISFASTDIKDINLAFEKLNHII